MYFRKEVEELLNSLNIDYQIMDTPIGTIQQAKSLDLPHREAATKTLLLNDKKGKLFCVTVFEDKSVDLKKLKEDLGCSRLSLASSEKTFEVFKVHEGISPLLALNDEKKEVTIVIDKYFENQLIMIHPNSADATLWLKCSDLIDIITNCGSQVLLLDL